MEVELSKIHPRWLYLDPASGKNKERLKNVRARSAMVVVGTDPLQRVFVLDAWAGRVGTNVIVDTFVSMAIKWGVVVAGFEDAGQQNLLMDPLLDAADKRGVKLPLTPVTVNTRVDKKWRIRTILQPVIGAGRLIILEDLIELINEVTSFPMNAKMDLVDAMATAVSLTPPVTTKGVGRDEQKELAKYLRDSGMSPMEIEDYLLRGGVDADSVIGETKKWWHNLTKQHDMSGY